MSEITTETLPFTETAPVTAPATTTAPAETTPPQDRDEQGRFKNPVQPRIDELTRKVRENEREATYWRTLAIANQAPAPAAPKKPEPADFQDYGAFVEALAEHKAGEKIDKALKEHDEKTAQRTADTQRAQTWAERQVQVRTKTSDYDAVVAVSDVQIAKHVGDLILESEVGPSLAYMFAKNPQVAERLNGLTPMQAAREFGRLEAAVNGGGASAPVAPVAAPAAAPAGRTTNAPPPAKAIPQTSSTQVDMSKLSTEDYLKARRAQGASWARR